MATRRLATFVSVEEYTTWLSWLFRNGMYIASDEHTMVRNLRITFGQQLKKFRPEWYRNRDWGFAIGVEKIYITHWGDSSLRVIVHQDGRIE